MSEWTYLVMNIYSFLFPLLIFFHLISYKNKKCINFPKREYNCKELTDLIEGQSRNREVKEIKNQLG